MKDSAGCEPVMLFQHSK